MKRNDAVDEEGEIGLRGWVGQSRGMASAHRHLDLEMNYVLSGTMTYLIAGRLLELPPRRLCLLWGGVPHQMIRNPVPVEAVWVTVPLTAVLRWGLPDHLILPLLTNGFVADIAPRPGDLDLLYQWLEDLPGPNHRQGDVRGGNDVIEIALLEMEARLRRFARGLIGASLLEADANTPTSAHADHGLSSVEAMARFLCRNFHQSVGVAEVAAEAHLHPNYAMTLFRRHTGMTISQYLTLQRVAHAQRLLATSDTGVQEVALESGFGSVSRFYEAFRQQTGNSPHRFRIQMGARRRTALTEAVDEVAMESARRQGPS